MRATKEGSKQAALSKAYFGARAARRADQNAELTASAPRIHKVLKSGKLSAASLDNGEYHTWTNREEALAVVAKLEAMNPGSRYQVS